MDIKLAYTVTPEGKIHLTEDNCLTNKSTFEELFFTHVLRHRANTESLLEWLDEATDFYLAPCSTIFHLNISGGLCLHTLAVLHNLDRFCDTFYPEFPSVSRVVCALLHDLCKANTYRPCIKSRKTGEYYPNGKPIWEDYQGYEFDEQLPYGHGEKSVFLAMKHIPLTNEEAMAIRWHMGGFDNAAKTDSRTLSKATEKFPVITLLQAADMIATSQGF